MTAFICELGHTYYRPVCSTHAPAGGRPANGDLWTCPECPVIAPEGQVFLAAWDEERRRAELLSQPVRWQHYMTRADRQRGTRGRQREGRLMNAGREPPLWLRRQRGSGRVVWIVPDDLWSDRLFIKAWWDPDHPAQNYSLEQWQGVRSPDPFEAARHVGNFEMYKYRRYRQEYETLVEELVRLTTSQPLMSDEVRRIVVDRVHPDLADVSDGALIELEFLLDDHERFVKLQAKTDKLLDLMDGCIEHLNAAHDP